jgi:hypothetical protein
VIVGFLIACVAPSVAQAEPIKYELFQSVPVPSGFFIYDRATSTLLDYQVTFNEVDFGYPTADFLAPAISLLSAGSNGFSFTDTTVTGTTPVGTFDSTLNFFRVTFSDFVLGGGDGQPGMN